MTTPIFILILWCVGPDAMALTSIEFTNKENCEQAGIASQQEFKRSWRNCKYVCVQK